MNGTRPDKELQEDILRTALAEYKMLSELRQGIVRAGVQRFSVFLVLLPAAASVAAAWKPPDNSAIAIGVWVVALVLGFFAFYQTIDRKVSTVIYTRGLNLIRCYLFTRCQDLDKYRILPVDSKSPPVCRVDQIPISLALIVSALAPLGFVLLQDEGDFRCLSVVVGIVVLGALLGLYYGLATHRIRKRMKDAGQARERDCEGLTPNVSGRQDE